MGLNSVLSPVTTVHLRSLVSAVLFRYRLYKVCTELCAVWRTMNNRY